MKKTTTQKSKASGLLAFVTLVTAASVCADPVIYRAINFSSNLGTEGDTVTSRLTTARVDSIQDSDAMTLESSVTLFSTASRRLNLTDASTDGSGVFGFIDVTPSSGSPSSPREFTQTGRVITFETGGPATSRTVLSPNDDFRVDLTVGENAFDAVVQTSVAANLAVRAAASLQLSDLTGSYSVFSYLRAFVDRTDSISASHQLIATEIEFAGDGTCTAQSADHNRSEMVTDWPDLTGRGIPVSRRLTSRIATSCSYSINATESSASVTLGYPSSGGSEEIVLNLYVAEGARYLLGEGARATNEGAETDWEFTLIVGTRRFDSVENQQLEGIYLLALLGHQLEGGNLMGSESVFGSRYAISFTGTGPDAAGYSLCNVLGSTTAGSQQEIGGIVPQVSGAVYQFTDSVVNRFVSCRYRANAGGEVELELTDSANRPQTLSMRLADDGATLIGGITSVSVGALSNNTDTPLGPGETSTAVFGIAQQAAASADSSEVIDYALPYILPVNPSIALATSVLPSSRSVALGAPATAFATIINASESDAHACRIQAPVNSGVDVDFQTTDPATNEPVGRVNQRVDIPAGQPGTFVITVRSQLPQQELELALEFFCQDAEPGAVFSGINTLLFSSEAAPSADVVALAATIDQDGIVKLDPATGNGVFSMATINLGESSDIEISVDTGETSLPVTLALCQTDPATGECINPSVPGTNPVILRADTGATPTVGIFASSSEPVPLDPALHRVFVRIKDPAGIVRGSTSVAISTATAP